MNRYVGISITNELGICVSDYFSHEYLATSVRNLIVSWLDDELVKKSYRVLDSIPWGIFTDEETSFLIKMKFDATHFSQ